MAYVELKYCGVCDKPTNWINQKCQSCADRNYRQKIAAWKALTTEEKLLDLMERMEKLENKQDISY